MIMREMEKNATPQDKLNWRFQHIIRDTYNSELRGVLQEYIDDGRLPNALYVDVFDVKFEAEHVNSGDCFHPSVEGHALLAEEEWLGSKWTLYGPMLEP